MNIVDYIFISILFIATWDLIDENANSTRQEIQNHEECEKEIEKLQDMIDYFRKNNEVDLIEARVYSQNN